MTRKMRAALAALAAGLAVPSASATAAPVYVPASCSFPAVAFKYKPRAMCFDNGFNLRRIVWTAYGGRRATARAQYEHNNCLPTCAEGTSTWVATRITLSRVRWACGRRIYTRLTGGPIGSRASSLWSR